MAYRPTYVKGDWKAICDVCGREVKASQLRQRWDGFLVCSDDWETRHPQDFVRGVADVQAPPFSRPEPSDAFIPFFYVRDLVDSLTISERITKNVIRNMSDTMSLSDSVTKNMIKPLAESMSLSDNVSTTIVVANPINYSALNTRSLG